MNPLVKKEIRLLLPSWLAILLLEVVQPWFWNENDDTYGVIPIIFFFGMIILAVDSFGREFSLGTFQSSLAQPVERRQIWRTKIAVLFFGAALIFAAYLVSYGLRLRLILADIDSVPAIMKNSFCIAMFASGVAALVALIGGLWTTLLLRQIAAAFWISFLAPSALLMLIVFFLPAKLLENDRVALPLLCSVAGVYIVSGFWLAHRLFHRAQDAAWTGGVISFSTWRYFEAGSKSSISTRHRKPFRALWKKEFQLQSITVFCAAALLALHIGIFFMRIFYANYHKGSIAEAVSDVFWLLWLIMPLIIGGTAVAEERKLGVAESQFCLPVSRRALFTIKFILTMIFGVLLGGVMPLLLETLAAHLGWPSEMFQPQNRAGNILLSGDTMFSICVLVVSAGLSLVAFFASTLARNFLQALSITIVTVVGCVLFGSFIVYISHQRGSIFGILPWPSLLPVIIGPPTMVATVLWLLYRNFSYFHESGRLWRRNILGVIGALLFVFVSSALIYNRAWEVFEPAEPAHGTAKLALANPPTLPMVGYRNLLVRLPDGRVWFDRLGDYYEGLEYDPSSRWKNSWRALTHPLPRSIGPQQFLAGSNWVVATTGYSSSSDFTETIGIQPDGTLWISGKSRSGNLATEVLQRYGSETNWHQIAQFRSSVVLLKTDRTLWRWGSDTNRLNPWPGLRTFTPHQIGTNSDWQELVTMGWIFTKRTDGRVWRLTADWKTEKPEFIRTTNYDEIILQTASGAGDQRTAFVRADGTLWVLNRYWDEKTRQEMGNGILQVGKENDWRAVAVSYGMMVGLKADGSLWQWHSNGGAMIRAINDPPIRLGIHDDWVAIVSAWDNVISLAADGSLWLWPDIQPYNNDQEALLKLPKQPKLLGNVFGKPD